MRSIAALLVALVVALPSGAQTILPQAGPATFDREGNISGDLARRTIDQFAACLLGRRRTPVLEALALPSGSAEQDKAFSGVMKAECLAPGELHFSSSVFRGSFYTALVRKEFRRKAVALGPGPADYTRLPAPGGGGTPIPPVAELLNFASCVVHADPENSRDVILSTAGSPKEDAAMTALTKAYDQCADTNTAPGFFKANLIGLLAEAYYREGRASE
jgi:hypothetical protein